MLGLWYQEHGNMIEARNCCRTYVLQALDMLSDDDPYNDSTAWLSLSKSLMKARDRGNAAAAYAVVAQQFDKLKAAIAKKKSKAPENSEVTSTTADIKVSSNALPSAMTALEISSNAQPHRPAIPGAAYPSPTRRSPPTPLPK